uniref:Uncharacterized protein n=1 Tax=Oryza meridionalis TaxID=40149 RepID=A0A0E0DM97_9ORYZ
MPGFKQIRKRALLRIDRATCPHQGPHVSLTPPYPHLSLSFIHHVCWLGFLPHSYYRCWIVYIVSLFFLSFLPPQLLPPLLFSSLPFRFKKRSQAPLRLPPRHHLRAPLRSIDGFFRSEGDRDRGGGGGGRWEAVLRRMRRHHHAHVARRPDRPQVALQCVRDPVQEEEEARARPRQEAATRTSSSSTTTAAAAARRSQ